jgi:hypothetical protein
MLPSFQITVLKVPRTMTMIMRTLVATQEVMTTMHVLQMQSALLVFVSMETALPALIIANVHQTLVTAVNAFQTRHS